MATIDFKKLMAQELARAKAKIKGKSIIQKEQKHYEQKEEQRKKDNFMKTALNFDELFSKFDPQKHKLPNTNSAYYIPNFLSSDFEKRLLSIIYSAPDSYWTLLKRRKLQCFGGKANEKNLNKFQIEALPLWCQQICDKLIFDSDIFCSNYNAPNHILVNEYDIGQGIMPHKDGPAYFSRVAIISLLSTICINFYDKPPLNSNNIDSPSTHQIILEPRSCLVFEGDLYSDMFHTIHECNYDVIDQSIANLHLVHDEENKNIKIGQRLFRKKKRVSLTVRHVYTSDVIKCIDQMIAFLGQQS